LVKQLGLGLSKLHDRFDQFLLRVDQAINAATLVIAVRVALRILHVADECVAPIAEPDGAVWADLWIDGAEVLVVADQQIIARRLGSSLFVSGRRLHQSTADEA
jgi:hypothetical protein